MQFNHPLPYNQHFQVDQSQQKQMVYLLQCSDLDILSSLHLALSLQRSRNPSSARHRVLTYFTRMYFPAVNMITKYFNSKASASSLDITSHTAPSEQLGERERSLHMRHLASMALQCSGYCLHSSEFSESLPFRQWQEPVWFPKLCHMITHTGCNMEKATTGID